MKLLQQQYIDRRLQKHMEGLKLPQSGSRLAMSDLLAALEAKEKKQRYVMIVVNALASTLWAHKELQEQFIENCRLRLGIDRITWDTQTSRIRNASSGKGSVSAKALNLRDELYDRLAVPEEHRL